MVQGDIVPLLFTVVSFAVAIGFLGGRIFVRTGIPDIVPIMALGLAVGPVFQLVNPAELISVAPLLGAIALLIILFNAGLNLDLFTVIRQTPRAALLAILTFGLSVVFVSIIGTVMLGLEPVLAVLLGSIIGGSSSIIVIPYLEQMGAQEDVKTILGLESTITDILCVVTTLAIVRLLQTASVEPLIAAQLVSARFSVAIVIGLVLGLFWLSILPRIRDDKYNYMTTLFIAFFTYGVSEFLGGNGPFSTLIFGLVLGNGGPMTQFFRFEKVVTVSKEILRFNSEISFLVRNIFFLYLGIITSIAGFQVALAGIIISGLLLTARFLAAPLATSKSTLSRQRNLIAFMLPRGLAAAVLASLPFTMGIAGTEVFVDIAFVVVLTTITMTVLGTLYLRIRKK